MGGSINRCLKVWEEELKGDEDQEYLLEGIKSGFRISNLEEGEQNKVQEVEVDNHPSTIKHYQPLRGDS